MAADKNSDQSGSDVGLGEHSSGQSGYVMFGLKKRSHLGIFCNGTFLV